MLEPANPLPNRKSCTSSERNGVLQDQALWNKRGKMDRGWVKTTCVRTSCMGHVIISGNLHLKGSNEGDTNRKRKRGRSKQTWGDQLRKK